MRIIITQSQKVSRKRQKVKIRDSIIGIVKKIYMLLNGKKKKNANNYHEKEESRNREPYKGK